MKYTVYGLKDPTDNLFRYVGVTKDYRQRITQHFDGSSRVGCPALQEWLDSVGGNCTAVLLEQIDTLHKNAEERRWIAKLKAEGHPLLNIANTLPHVRRPFERKKGTSVKAFWDQLTAEQRTDFIKRRGDAIRAGHQLRKLRRAR